jgi:hypothetical protein
MRTFGFNSNLLIRFFSCLILQLVFLPLDYALAGSLNTVTKKIIRGEINIYYNDVNVSRTYIWNVQPESYVLPPNPPAELGEFSDSWLLGTTKYKTKAITELKVVRSVTAPSSNIDQKVEEALNELKNSGDPLRVSQMNSDASKIENYFERWVTELENNGHRLPTTGHAGGVLNNVTKTLSNLVYPLLSATPVSCWEEVGNDGSSTGSNRFLIKFKRVSRSFGAVRKSRLKGCGQQTDYIRECLQKDIAASRLKWFQWRMTGEEYIKIIDHVSGPDYYPQTTSITHQWGVITPGPTYGPWFIADPWKNGIVRMTGAQKADYLNKKGFSSTRTSWKNLMARLYGYSGWILANSDQTQCAIGN